ncbi:PstS family phosphate ABC transporter substrate-binding protein [Longirhabdus pacifica]|uniref:PstS family phosphate ABC transporter substrate-binding protein n=1 Tax=Longirhabdus pacifica TaxID=2305227 RepID=UPI001008E770|nr:PstS family phosphate ABC transporter substrate-binding protein [Longirhabdus pacifica]
MFQGFLRKGSFLLLALVLTFALAACGDAEETNENEDANNQVEESNGSNEESEEEMKEEMMEISGEIALDGSSTVYPISVAVAEEFMAEHGDVDVTVNVSGSSNGIAKLIEGEIDIADASRQMKDKEYEQLQEKGEEAIEMPVAYDGITVVINKENDFATEMTVAELKMIWEKDSTITKWSEVREGWPEEEIKLYGPGTASGTFEYFTGAINGTKNESRIDYNPSEDDNVIVNGVSGDPYAMGYFGFSYYVENQDKLAAISIKVDENAEAIAPTVETIKDQSYQPLSRPIYIYPTKSVLEREEVKAFIKYYMSEKGQMLAEEVGYVALPQAEYDKNLTHVE